jgi:hypothetical protein
LYLKCVTLITWGISERNPAEPSGVPRCKIRIPPSSKTERVPLSRGQTFSLGQPGLPLIEGPEAVRSKLQRNRYVQRIECSHAKRRNMPKCQPFADSEGRFGLFRENPDSAGVVLLESLHNERRFTRSDRASKHILLNCMDEFGSLEGCEPNSRSKRHAAIYFRRVLVLKIVRDKEAAVCIDIQ